MSLAFIPSDAALLAVQAATVAAPRVAPGLEPIQRLRGRGWALVPLVSIVLVIFAIRYASDTASWLTYLALVAVPLLAALALGWAGFPSEAAGPRIGWRSALSVGTLFMLAWRSPGSLLGEGAGVLLSALSCVTLGVLLAAVTPASWLKVGIVLMAAADTWLVASHLLQAPNATLEAAHPAAGLPRLQTEVFGSISMGYGDLFIAAVLGAVYASDRRRQRAGALSTFALAAIFDLLFLLLDELPATVPVALALILMEVYGRRSSSRRRGAPIAAAHNLPPGLGKASAGRRRSTPAGGTPRQVK